MSSNQQGAMRGLSLYIGDIRNCQTKEQEEKIVYKEMAKIRGKFQNKAISGYDKKKYVWKLIYSHILGYDVDFGHEESLNLINAAKFSEKCTGYIATGIMLNEKSDQQLFDRVMNAIKQDLTCGNEVCEALALATIGNIGSVELSNQLAQVVAMKAFDERRGTPVYVRKRACLTLLSFFKRDKGIYNHDIWLQGFKDLLHNTNYGLLMSACSLILGVITVLSRNGFEPLVHQLIKILASINTHATDYFYYQTPCPWLQIKVLKLLQMFPPPEDKSTDLVQINEYLLEIVNKTEVTKNVNKNNSDHSILFEAINLIIHYKNSAYEVLRKDIVTLLGKFISVKEPNIRYLALETMSKLQGIQVSSFLLKQHLQKVFVSLRDPDISIRRRALDLLFCLCDSDSAGEVVNELLDYLQENDYELKEEMVLKIAILAEKFAQNLNWYLDVIIKLIEFAGDHVSEDIWFRVAQIITGFGDQEPNIAIQKYASHKMFDILQTPSLHEMMVKIGAYVLSEFGNLIYDQPGRNAKAQFELIHKHFYNISPSARGMILTSYMKMLKNAPELKSLILPTLKQYQQFWDEDIQQRVCEYLLMIELSESDPAAKEFVIEALDNMPNFSDSLQNNSILNRRIMKLKIEKGFTISKDEAMSKAKQELENTESTMSAALQQVHTSPPAAQEAKHKQPSPQKKKAKEDPEAKYLQNVDNLLDMDMVPQQPAAAQQSPLDLISSISGLQPPQGEDIMNNRFYLAHADRFSPQQTVKLGPQTFEAKNCSNGNQWKAMLPISMREGVIYSDDQIEVTCQIQIIKFLERIQISFIPKVLGPITDLQAKLSSTAFNDQLEMAVSPVKFRPDGIPEVIMMIMLKETMTLSPSLKFQYSQGSNQFQIEFRLPIFLNKFTEPVEMPSDAFAKTWDDITHNRPSSFQKIDAFIKNPAPPQVPVTEVLKKVANFFQNSMNLKVFPPEDPTNFWSVKAVGQVNFKPPTQVGFPSGPADIQKPIQNELYNHLGLRFETLIVQ